MYSVIHNCISEVMFLSIEAIVSHLNQTGSTDVDDNVVSISLVNC